MCLARRSAIPENVAWLFSILVPELPTGAGRSSVSGRAGGGRIAEADTSMKVALSSDERTGLTEFLLGELRRRNHEVLAFGSIAEADPEVDWPLSSRNAAEAVARGDAEEAIVCCWTGTGASIAANKVAGIRAALCADAETAKGARLWNHANVLALSLRSTSEPVAREILDAWYGTPFSADEWNLRQIERITRSERRG